MKRIVAITISIIALVCGVTFSVYAQAATIDLTLTTLPVDPQPLQKVTISAESYGTDLNQADLTWTYNGKTIASGIGQTEVSVVAPASGVTGNVTLTATGGEFATTSASILLRPASVDLLWEGLDSYVPPFYKGRAIPATGAIIRVTAIPTISAPRNLSYTWTQNDSVVQDSSGYNKSSLTFRNSSLVPTEQIAVSETSGSFSGESTVDITPGDPAVVGYFNNNGYIDYASGSTNTLNFTGTGTIIHFEPYYFSIPNNVQQDLTFSYTDNSGGPLPGGDLVNELRLSAPAGGGQSQFNVGITTTAYTLQNISRLFSVNFN